jgi:hypothetical protein
VTDGQDSRRQIHRADPPPAHGSATTQSHLAGGGSRPVGFLTRRTSAGPASITLRRDTSLLELQPANSALAVRIAAGAPFHLRAASPMTGDNEGVRVASIPTSGLAHRPKPSGSHLRSRRASPSWGLDGLPVAVSAARSFPRSSCPGDRDGVVSSSLGSGKAGATTNPNRWCRSDRVDTWLRGRSLLLRVGR